MAQVIRKYKTGGSAGNSRLWVEAQDPNIKFYGSNYERLTLKKQVLGDEYRMYKSRLGLDEKDEIALDKYMSEFTDGLLSGRLTFEDGRIKDSLGVYTHDGQIHNDGKHTDNDAIARATSYLIHRFLNTKPFKQAIIKNGYSFNLESAIGNENPSGTFSTIAWDAMDPKDATTGKRAITNRANKIAEILESEGNKLYKNVEYRNTFGWRGDDFQLQQLNARKTADSYFKLAAGLRDGEISEQDKGLMDTIGLGDLSYLLTLDTAESKAYELKLKKEEAARAKKAAEDAAKEEQAEEDSRQAIKDQIGNGFYALYPWEPEQFYWEGELIEDPFNSDNQDIRYAADLHRASWRSQYKITDDNALLEPAIAQGFKYAAEITAGATDVQNAGLRLFLLSLSFNSAPVAMLVNDKGESKYYGSLKYINGKLTGVKAGTDSREDLGTFVNLANLNWKVTNYPQYLSGYDPNDFNTMSGVRNLFVSILGALEDPKVRDKVLSVYTSPIRMRKFLKLLEAASTAPGDVRVFKLDGKDITDYYLPNGDGDDYYAVRVHYDWKGKAKENKVISKITWFKSYGDEYKKRTKSHKDGGVLKAFNGVRVPDPVVPLLEGAAVESKPKGPYVSHRPQASFNDFEEDYQEAMTGMLLDGADQAHLAAATADLVSAVGGFVPGLNIASTVTGIASTLTELGTDIYENLSGKETAQSGWSIAGEAAANLGMDLVSLLPGGKSAKLVKSLNTIATYAPHIVGALLMYDIFTDEHRFASVKSSFDKVKNLQFDRLNTEDFNNITFGLRTILGMNNLRKAAGRKIFKGEKTGYEVTGKVKTADGVETITARVNVDDIKTWSRNKSAAEEALVREANKSEDLAKNKNEDGTERNFTKDDITVKMQGNKIKVKTTTIRKEKERQKEFRKVFEDFWGFGNEGFDWRFSDARIAERAPRYFGFTKLAHEDAEKNKYLKPVRMSKKEASKYEVLGRRRPEPEELPYVIITHNEEPEVVRSEEPEISHNEEPEIVVRPDDEMQPQHSEEPDNAIEIRADEPAETSKPKSKLSSYAESSKKLFDKNKERALTAVKSIALSIRNRREKSSSSNSGSVTRKVAELSRQTKEKLKNAVTSKKKKKELREKIALINEGLLISQLLKYINKKPLYKQKSRKEKTELARELLENNNWELVKELRRGGPVNVRKYFWGSPILTQTATAVPGVVNLTAYLTSELETPPAVETPPVIYDGDYSWVNGAIIQDVDFQKANHPEHKADFEFAGHKGKSNKNRGDVLYIPEGMYDANGTVVTPATVAAIQETLNAYTSKDGGKHIFGDVSNAYLKYKEKYADGTLEEFASWYNNSVQALRKWTRDKTGASYGATGHAKNAELFNTIYANHSPYDKDRGDILGYSNFTRSPLTFTNLDLHKDLRQGTLGDLKVWIDNAGFLRFGDYGTTTDTKLDHDYTKDSDIYTFLDPVREFRKLGSKTKTDYAFLGNLANLSASLAGNIAQYNNLKETLPVLNDVVYKLSIVHGDILPYLQALRSAGTLNTLASVPTSSEIEKQTGIQHKAFSQGLDSLYKGIEHNADTINTAIKNDQAIRNENLKAEVDTHNDNNKALIAYYNNMITAKNTKTAAISLSLLNYITGTVGDFKSALQKETLYKERARAAQHLLSVDAAYDTHNQTMIEAFRNDEEFAKVYKKKNNKDISELSDEELKRAYFELYPSQRRVWVLKWNLILNGLTLDYYDDLLLLVLYPGDFVEVPGYIYDPNTGEILDEDGNPTGKMHVSRNKKGGRLTASDRKKIKALEDFNKSLREDAKTNAKKEIESNREFGKMVRDLSKQSLVLLKTAMQI